MKYIGVILLLLLSCEQEEVKELVKDTSSKIEVSVMKLGKLTVQDTLSFDGRLIASQEIDLVSQVSGELKSIKANGTKIPSGNTIFEVNSDFHKSGYQVALASYKMAKLNAEKLEKNIVSYRELHKTGDISDDELKTFEVQYLSAKQQKWQSKNALDQAKIVRDNAIYKAPFSGVFGNTNLVVGQQISLGQSLGKLANLNKLKINLSLSVEEISRVMLGDNVHFSNNSISLNGTVKSISPVADTSTGTYLVELSFVNDGKVAISGLFGKVQLFGKKYENVTAMKSEFISSIQGKYYLNEVSNDTIKRTFISSKMKLGKFDILSDSDKNGLNYVIRSNNKITIGDTVKVVN